MYVHTNKNKTDCVHFHILFLNMETVRSMMKVAKQIKSRYNFM